MALQRKTALKKGNSKLKRGVELRVKAKTQETIDQEKADQERMWKMFEEIWTERPHVCIQCGKWLGDELLSVYMDHLLEKGNDRYKHLRYEKENIGIVCWEDHSKKSNGFPGDKHKAAIENAKQKYDL